MSYIYMIQNKVNNKIYIGSTVDYEKRYKSHMRSLRGNYHDNKVLQKDFNLYGECSFNFIKLCETVSEEERFEIEANIIKELKTYENGYNLTIDGRGKYLITKKTRLKMSKNSTGSGNPFYGKKHTKETRKKLSKNAKSRTGSKNPFYGKKHKEESIEKMKKSYDKLKNSGWVNPQKGVPKSEKSKLRNVKSQPNRKPVYAEGKKYISVSECARDLGVVNATVTNRIKNKKYKNYYYIDD
ncbi:hypothetical protein MRS_135 [Staphylococcus phage MR003]|nr:hypothetical protein MRS_135 [Staphylococcus phage MR003]